MRAGDGVWRHTPAWARAFVAAAPWVTVALLVAMFAIVSSSVTAAPGLAFELPEGEVSEAQDAALAAIVAPVPGLEGKTLVFFDDARYILPDPSSESSFRGNLAEHVARAQNKTMLLLVDRRISSGALMKLAGMVRRVGVTRLTVAEKRD